MLVFVPEFPQSLHNLSTTLPKERPLACGEVLELYSFICKGLYRVLQGRVGVEKAQTNGYLQFGFIFDIGGY